MICDWEKKPGDPPHEASGRLKRVCLGAGPKPQCDPQAASPADVGGFGAEGVKFPAVHCPSAAGTSVLGVRGHAC
jgi:hypothetical protein